MRGHNLDDVDRELIRLLESDGRAPFAKLGAELGLSTDAVSARYKRLEAEGVVRVIGVVNPAMLGYRTIASLAIAAYNDVPRLIERLCERPEITFLATARGTFNLMGEIVAPDSETLVELAYDVVPSLGRVEQVEVWDFLRVHKWDTGMRRAPELAHSTEPMPSLDDEDVRVLKLLQQNARLRYTELAESLNLPYSNVRRRCQQLFEWGVLDVALVVDRLSAQQHTMGTLGLSISGPPQDVLDEVAKLPEVEILIRTGGRYQAIAEVRCSSAGDVGDLIDERIAGIPGVVDVETHLYARIEKLPAQWNFAR